MNVLSAETVDASSIDSLELARVDRERAAAATRFVRDRDQARLAASMARLDVEEQAAREVRPAPRLEAKEAVAYLRDLERLWTDAPGSRRQLAEAMFERIEVLGLRRIRVVPTREAIDVGLAEAFAASAGGWSEPGRSRAHPNRLLVRLVPHIETRIEVVLPARMPRLVERSA